MVDNIVRKIFVFWVIAITVGSIFMTIIPNIKADLNDGLVGYWSFDNGTAEDESDL